jgi:hypothetical protein
MVQSSTKPMIWGMDAPFLNKPDPIFFADWFYTKGYPHSIPC